MKLYTLIVFLLVFNFSEAQTSTDSVLIKANNLLQIKETNQAILLLDETIKTIPNNLNKQSALQLLSKAYSKKGDDAKALSTLNEMMVLKDSLIKIETTQTLDALRAGYEADKQEKELALQKAKINQQQVIILAISICSLLSLGLVFLYFSRKKNALKNEIVLQF
jgi:predicted Zn-dependent protease